VRRRDEPHVHGDRPAGADALELVLLEHPEELDLEVQGGLGGNSRVRATMNSS
jgi:hypothetical protein